MTLRFTLSEQTNLDYNLYFLKNSAAHRKQQRNALLIPPAIFLGIGLYAYRTTGHITSFVCLFPIMALLYVGFVLFTRPGAIRRNILAHLRTPVAEMTYGDYELTLEEDGLHARSHLGYSHYHWSAVASSQLDAHYLIITLAGTLGYPIPVATIGRENAQAAHAFIQQHISNK